MAADDPPAAAGPGPGWLALMLDEVGYGMVLLDDQAQLLFANHAARAECESGHPLQLRGHQLLAAQPEHAAMLQQALAGAQRGRRKLLSLGDALKPCTVAVIPLHSARSRTTLLMMGKRLAGDPLQVQGFALCHALTQAETRVLQRLCQGQYPSDVARLHGVSLATVRSQISSMRSKTGARSIRGLLRQVAVLPPVVGSLRNGCLPDGAPQPGPAGEAQGL
jgi:DNA-binding CsgD family transcriptional regulator